MGDRSCRLGRPIVSNRLVGFGAFGGRRCRGGWRVDCASPAPWVSRGLVRNIAERVFVRPVLRLFLLKLPRRLRWVLRRCRRARRCRVDGPSEQQHQKTYSSKNSHPKSSPSDSLHITVPEASTTRRLSQISGNFWIIGCTTVVVDSVRQASRFPVLRAKPGTTITVLW